MAGIKCPTCGLDVEYYRTNCERGHFIGFPNVRKASEMLLALQANYNSAVAGAVGRGLATLVREVEALLDGSIATVNVDTKLFRNMAYSQNYMSYYKALALGLRKIAEERYHAHRGAVDEKIHPGYRAEIVNAALSVNGAGLTNYGLITLELQNAAIEDRASVMRENAFNFYERNDLGRRDAAEAPGWRSTWEYRAQLGAAQVAPDLTPTTAQNDLPSLVLFSGASRQDDRYLEVHIFGELSWQSLRKATLEKPLTDPQDRDAWDFGRQKLGHRGVAILDRANP